MPLPRRDFLRLAAWVAAGAAAGACSPIYRQLAGGAPSLDMEPGDGLEFSLLSRLTYGPRPAERRRVTEIGLAGWIEEQLAPESIDDPMAWRLRPLDALARDADELDDREREEVLGQIKQGTLLRQVYSRRQLFETMVEFWTDHFNISVHKGNCLALKVVDDREVTRRHALGSFRDLLWASAHSPAMLIYLDNQVSDRTAPNENYARELMELHTLGVDGGYTQHDVMELARCLTGWTVRDHFWRGRFTFDPDRHDGGPKAVLGMAIFPDGQGEAESVLERLARHPATARFLARKLVRRFLNDGAEQAAPEIVARAAAAFERTGGDIGSVLRVVLLDGLAAKVGLGPKLKRPVDFVVSALRLTQSEFGGGSAVNAYLGRMGQPTFEWPTPEGPPDVAPAWSGNLMPRWQFALGLARGEIEGIRTAPADLIRASGASEPKEALAALGRLLLGLTLPAGASQGILSAFGEKTDFQDSQFAAIVLAGLLASPAFQWR